jgi:hypothetical protein
LYGRRDLLFRGCIDGQGIFVGRGLLTGDETDEERMHLRLERRGGRISAYCSADGEQWYTLGQMELASDPVQVGVYANGYIRRDIHHGAYPEGTAVRFESFQLWTGSD